MRIACLLIIGLIFGAPSSADPPTGTVVVETLLNVVDRMRIDLPDKSANTARLLNSDDIFIADNYPPLAQDREVEGKVTVRVGIDPQGLVTHCQTVGKPPPELGGPTCALFLAQARFDPARDRKGRAVKSTLTRSVKWVLEALKPMPFADSTDRSIFTFNSDGSIANCRRETTGVRAEELGVEKQDPCTLMALDARMAVTMAGLDDPSQWELLAEYDVRTGPIDIWEAIGSGEDEQVIFRGGHKLVVDADGTVRDCAPIHPKELEVMIPLNCERIKRGKYVAASETDRRIAMISISYLRKRYPGSKNI